MVGKLIVFEGIDGCGKDSQLDMLADALQQYNIPIRKDREPTNNLIGKLIKEEFLIKNIPIDEMALRLLFTADCREHITGLDGIINTKNSCINILSSRYYHSNIAYGSLYNPMKTIIDLNYCNRILCPPDLTVIIDIPAEVAIERIISRGKEVEKYETLDKLRKVREAYTDLPCMLEDEKFIIVDGTQSKEIVFENIWNEVSKLEGWLEDENR